MLVILDTNVLIAALISPYGAPDAIYRGWRAGRFDLLTCALQVEELRRVSRYPKLKAILPAHRVGTIVNQMRRAVVLEQLPALPENIHANDPADEFLLAMAMAADADYLVTGDHRAGLLERRSIARARILTPAAFCVEAL